MNKSSHFAIFVITYLFYNPISIFSQPVAQTECYPFQKTHINTVRIAQLMQQMLVSVLQEHVVDQNINAKNLTASRWVSSEVAKIINLRGKPRGIQPARRLKN